MAGSVELKESWKEFCIIIFGIMRTVQGQLLEWKRLTLSAFVVLLWARGNQYIAPLKTE